MQKIIIITAPSGAGKTSITRHLLAKFPQLQFSISATTRLPRAAEKDGVDYYFITEDAFKQHIQNHDFLEWEMVYEGKYYGTLTSEMNRMWQQQNIPVLDIDVKGALHVQQEFPQHCLSIFIKAPSIEALQQRLENRGTETPESLQTRLNKASYEMSFASSFDAIIINDDLQRAQQEAADLVAAFINK